MQVYAKSNRLWLKTFLFFLVVLVIAFLPVSSFLFFLKNDAFNGYFPPKYFMSESIHAGHLPLWNPYINFGIPQYGDMSSGYWSPVTWLIASTAGYNAYTFTLELLAYVLLAGLGMYKLSGVWITARHIRILTGIVYMCCGFTIGHLQHFNWISGAAFLPCCIYSYINLTRNFSVRNAAMTALLFYLLAASAHPGITISAIYFFVAAAFFLFFKNENNQPAGTRLKNAVKVHAIFIAVLLLLCAGMITGYLDILPHFVRGEKIGLEDSLGNPTNIQSWISAILPFATVKNDALYNTDLSMRNSYFSLTLFIFFLLACVRKKNSWQLFFLFTGLFFCLLASGGIFKTLAYKTMPFLGYVRLNGEFRIFALLCFILVAAIELDKFVLQKNKFGGAIKLIYYLLEVLLFFAVVVGLYKCISNKEGLLYHNSEIFSQPGISARLKVFIDSIGFYDTLWIQGIIQLLFLWAIKWCLKKGNWHLLTKLTVINMAVCSLMNIPFTGVGKARLAQVQAVLNKAPGGMPVPAMRPVSEQDSLSPEEKGLVGDWSFYNKQPGTKMRVPYPIVLKNMNNYFNSNDSSIFFLDKPFVFVEPREKTFQVTITAFTGSKINISAYSDAASRLVLQQNLYPHWYYSDGVSKKSVNPAGINFMSAPIGTGRTNINFSFEPVLVKWMMLLSAISFLFALALVIKPGRKHPLEHVV